MFIYANGLTEAEAEDLERELWETFDDQVAALTVPEALDTLDAMKPQLDEWITTVPAELDAFRMYRLLPVLRRSIAENGETPSAEWQPVIERVQPLMTWLTSVAQRH